MPYPTISLFSGAMGLDLGLISAGLDVKISQDIDLWCARTMEANHHPYIMGDIQALIAKDPQCQFLFDGMRDPIDREDVFAVVGGPPCQPFSTAGKRLGTNDPRGSLFMEFAHVVRTLHPRFFVMENVKGLLSSAIRPRTKDESDKRPLEPDEQPGSVFKVIKQTFEDIGYKIVYGCLDAAHYGVPQFRERLLIIGSRDHEDIFLPIPTHFQVHQNPDFRWKTLRSAIEDLEEIPGPCARFSPDRLEYLRLVPMGGNWRNLPQELIPLAMGGAYESGGGKAGFYRRLDYNQPSPTLVTSPVQKATMLCHPTQDRPLSVREYARIQQFPDSWKIEGNATDCYRQIGNAVPTGLGQAIGQMLISVAKGTSKVHTKRLRGTSVHNNFLPLQHTFVVEGVK